METNRNKFRLIDDGKNLYFEMISCIRNAKYYVYLETFILSNDETGRDFQEALIEKAKEGVKVVLIYDALGSIFTPERFFKKMYQNGVQVNCFNPLLFNSARLLNLRGFHNRDHRKILVIDDAIAFIGGQNISNSYINTIRDCQIKIEGDLSLKLKDTFLESLRIVKNVLYHKKRYIKPLLKRFVKNQKHDKERVLRDIPSMKIRYIYKEYLRFIHRASKEILLVNAYFLPSKNILHALIQAKNRGVTVKIILPKHSDFFLVDLASQHMYQKLLENDIQIYWYHKKFIHAKFMVVDRAFVTIGSANLDYRSFLYNYEANVFLESPELAKECISMFQSDLKESLPLDLKTWKNRPFHKKMFARFAFLFRYLL